MAIAPDHRAARAMWEDYLASLGPDGRSSAGLAGGALPVVDTFGDGPGLADELLGLVLKGVKRATSSLLVEYELSGDDVPSSGDCWIVCDGSGTPRAVLVTTEARKVPFRDVDAAFASDEGEGDGSLAAWRRGHAAYWRRVGAHAGFALTQDSVVVAERFRVVWPPEHADG